MREAQLSTAPSRTREQVGEAEWKLRTDLAACYRLVALHGWDDLMFTHIWRANPGWDA